MEGIATLFIILLSLIPLILILLMTVYLGRINLSLKQIRDLLFRELQKK